MTSNAVKKQSWLQPFYWLYLKHRYLFGHMNTDLWSPLMDDGKRSSCSLALFVCCWSWFFSGVLNLAMKQSLYASSSSVMCVCFTQEIRVLCHPLFLSVHWWGFLEWLSSFSWLERVFQRLTFPNVSVLQSGVTNPSYGFSP